MDALSQETIAILGMGVILAGFFWSLHRDVAGLRERTSRLEGLYEGLSESVAELRESVRELRESVTGLQMSVAGLQATVAGLQTTVAGLQTAVAGLQDSVSGLQHSITVVRETVSRLEQRADNRFPPPSAADA